MNDEAVFRTAPATPGLLKRMQRCDLSEEARERRGMWAVEQ